MTTDHDKYMQEIVCNCKSCGAPISRYYYVGYPFCDTCRSKYREERRRPYIYHAIGKGKIHNYTTNEDIEIDIPLCNQHYLKGKRFYLTTDDNPVNCIKCLKILKKEVKT